MSGNAKDIIRLIIIIFALALICSVGFYFLSSCESFKLWVMRRNGVDHEVYGGSFRYVSDEDCPNGNINDNLLVENLDFKAGKVYYCVYECNYVSYSEEDEWAGVSMDIAISPCSVVSATLQEASTGNYREYSEEDVTHIILSYQIPEEVNVIKRLRVVLKLEMLADGFPRIRVSYTGAQER